MILIGFGGNLPSSVGLPVATCRAALTALPGLGVEVRQVSPLYRSEPVPSSGQPWFVNGVAALETSLKAPDLLVRLHQVEEQFGRVRSVRNAARTLDLDLLAYDDEVHTGEVEVPHPRMHLRAFVLVPLADLAPGWRHPILGKTAKDLLAALPPDQGLERFSHES
jgi:2-amino-4-hydroxy-6-hydroxymethyldihydropteridine diphosphokinase